METQRAAGASCEPETDVVVVGAGIAGLTAAALLSARGMRVVLLEAHHQSGGCAGTFRRGPYTFDVGATQVAGLEPGGIHTRIFTLLGVDPPAATPLDPGCVVDLADGQPPIPIWRDPVRWQQERQRQFPGSERFWRLCEGIHRSNWPFAARDPVLPPRNLWDLGQLLGALRPATVTSGLLVGASMADLLLLTGCGGDPRLRRFLDLQLKLYSQEPADRTAALYGATVLAMVQEPLGLWHLHGSMQCLSDRLEDALRLGGGSLQLGHRVLGLERRGPNWLVVGQRSAGPRAGTDAASRQSFRVLARDVVVTVPPQRLPDLLGDALPEGYRRRLQGLPEPSGALVFYGAVPRAALPADCPSHLQLDGTSPGPLFVSVSQEGDGRAPAGTATVIASIFTGARDWFRLERADYRRLKAETMESIRTELETRLGLGTAPWLHQELATPRGFARWTGRPWGYVGGLGQHPSRFGPFGLASRTPIRGLWLCGDSIHPGEGTAGVSHSALMVCRQLLQQRRWPPIGLSPGTASVLERPPGDDAPGVRRR